MNNTNLDIEKIFSSPDQYEDLGAPYVIDESEFITDIKEDNPSEVITELLKDEEFTLSDEQQRAFDIIENTNESMLLSGPGGTGKSYLLRYLIRNTKKNILVTATTGIAAYNVMGCTIHSGLQIAARSIYYPNNYMSILKDKGLTESLVNKLDLLIIEEASMLRADLAQILDKLFRELRHRPAELFGGVQLLLVGDLSQIEPVVQSNKLEYMDSKKYIDTYFNGNPFFFSYAPLSNLRSVRLTKVFRQSDATFLYILDSIRSRTNLSYVLPQINKRVCPYQLIPNKDDTIIICGTNKVAKEYNSAKRSELHGPEYIYNAVYDERIDKSAYPMETEVRLKVGSKVMILVNSRELGVNNGTIGIVQALTEDYATVRVKLNNGEYSDVTITRYPFKIAVPKVEGDSISCDYLEFNQLPLREAWALTVHKAQGQSFDNVHIDIDKAFAHGQIYTALSRCRTIEGLTLEHPIKDSDVIVRKEVLEKIREEENGYTNY